MSAMIDFVSILKENPNGVLATRDGEGISTRVFQFLFADGNRVYFCTGRGKPVYLQLAGNPRVSFCTYPKDFNPVLSVNGKAVFTDDMKLKARALKENPAIEGIYKTPDNPEFAMFYIDADSLQTFSFAEGPKTYTL